MKPTKLENWGEEPCYSFEVRGQTGGQVEEAMEYGYVEHPKPNKCETCAWYRRALKKADKGVFDGMCDRGEFPVVKEGRCGAWAPVRVEEEDEAED